MINQDISFKRNFNIIQMPKTAYPKKIVDHYIEQVKNKIKVNKVVLFGSFAYGKPNIHSDIDLVVISPSFKNQDFMKRMIMLSHLRDEITYQISMDIVGYTEKEFNEMGQYSINLAEIQKKGKVIYSS